MTRHLLSVDDLSEEALDWVLTRATAHADGVVSHEKRSLVLGTLFLTPSMRTRAGFAVAAARLGGSTVGVDELRIDPSMSASESVEDAVRVLSGWCDVLVTRTPDDAGALAAASRCPVINGGDAVAHPSQAIIDLVAMERQAGRPLAELTVALCGDLTMRAATSLLRLLERRRPAHLVLMAPESRGVAIPEPLRDITRLADPQDLSDVDVLELIGLPEVRRGDRLDADQREPWRLTASRLAELPEHAVVLSPMPVVDELSAEARADRRLRMFEQSDGAVFVRMALLEWALGDGPGVSRVDPTRSG